MEYNYENLENFLVGTFHQDIDNPVDALHEYIENVDKQWLLKLSKEIEHFLLNELPECYKERFIQECTFIYYPAIGLKPLEWLTDVLSEINRSF